MNDSFAKGATVYMHLTGPMGKHLLHAAQMQPGLEQPPTSNSGKLKLLDALLALIDSNKLSIAAMPQAASAKPEHKDTGNQQGGVAAPNPTAPAVAELPVSATGSRKLMFDGAGIDRAGGVVALTRVYLDGYNGFSPFIKYFPVPHASPCQMHSHQKKNRRQNGRRRTTETIGASGRMWHLRCAGRPMHCNRR